MVGSVVSFLGLVRDLSKNNNLKFMEIEHYPNMSEKVLRELCQKAIGRWGINGISLIHRVGKLYPGDNIVFLLVASAHRTEAFNASPSAALKTNLTGSSLPPIPKGCISHLTSPQAMEGQISSMCEPSTRSLPCEK